MLLELAREPDLVARWQGEVCQYFLSLCPDNRPRYLFLVHIGFNRDYPLVVDAVDLAQPAGDLEFCDGTQGDQTLCRWDEQLTEYVGHLAVRLSQLDGDVVILVALAEGGDLDTIKGNLEGEADDIRGKA
ncbi:hypothetical protein ES703_104514 [subsurface metagenome]